MAKNCNLESEIIVPNLGTICMLCQNLPPIKNSHVWPKFAVTWLKENSSPYIRRGDNPNLRLQDVTKFPLLCLECENRFSKFETEFCERVFKPINSDYNHKKKSIVYGRWLSRFAISLSWRILAVDFQNFVNRVPDAETKALEAFEYWRLYLLGKSQKIRPFSHNVFFFSYLNFDNSDLENVPNKLHTYLHRCFDGGIFYSKKPVAFTLLPGMAFWSPLTPNDDGGFSSSIKEKGKYLMSQKVGGERFGNLLHEGAELLSKQVLSERQNSIVKKDFEHQLENTPEVKKKNILKPLLHDRELKIRK